MNINSLWKSKRKRSSRYKGSRVSCTGNTFGHDADCFSIQRRMEQFDSLLLAEHSRIQEHIDALTDLRCDLKSDCQCRDKFERLLGKMEKRVMKLRGEMQDCRKYLLDADCYLQQNEQRQRELQHRLQELWNLVGECCQLREFEVEKAAAPGSPRLSKTVSVPPPAATATPPETTTVVPPNPIQ